MSNLLSQIRPREKPTYLAAVLKKVLPDPGIDTHAPSNEAEQHASDLLEEIKTKLRIDPADNSLETRSKLYKYLTREISKYALDQVPRLTIRERVGQKGLLPASLYKIVFTDRLNDVHLKQGVRIEEVRKTLEEPYAVQHLSPGSDMSSDTQPISLYTRDFDGPSPGDRYSLLVRSNRKGSVQEVDVAWMLFHSDIEVQTKKEPLDMLKAFVDVYGMSFTVGQTRSRFVLYKAVEGSNVKIQLDNPLGHDFVFDTMVRWRLRNQLEIAITYSIDTTNYEESLRNHGIVIKK